MPMSLTGFGAFTPAAAAVSTFTATWSPARKSAAVILSNDNLTAFGDNVVDDQGCYATGFKTSGKYYFEYVVDAHFAGTDGNGLIITTVGTNAYGNANGTNGVHLNLKSGVVKINGSEAGTVNTVAASGRGHCAVDIDNRKVWFRTPGGDWNNSGSDNPATNTGGFTLAAGTNVYIATYVPGAGQMTAHFGSSSWVGSAPSGFVEWPILDGSEEDGTQLLAGDAAMTTDWTTDQATLTASAVVAPNGETDGATLVENTANTRHIVYQQKGSLTADATFRASVYAKYNTRRYMQLVWSSDNGTASAANAYFDLQTGTVTDTEFSGATQIFENVSMLEAADGYYKCSFDVRLSATTTAGYFVVALSNVGTYGAPLDSDSPQYTGTSSGIYLWRPKLVQL